MLHLRGRGCDMRLLFGDEFLGPRLCYNRAWPTIVADIVYRLVHRDRLLVDVRNSHVGDIVDSAVIKEITVVPVSALIAHAGVARSINHAAVEAYVRSPIPI